MISLSFPSLLSNPVFHINKINLKETRAEHSQDDPGNVSAGVGVSIWDKALKSSFSGDSVTAQCAKPPLVTTATHIGVPAGLLLLQLPANTPGKTAEGGPTTWFPPTHVGHQGGVPGSWLLPSHWTMN